MNPRRASRVRETSMINSSTFRRLLSGITIVATGLLASAAHAQRSERAQLNISAYTIDAEIDSQAHHLQAKTTVTFTAPENAEMVSFGFHPALKVTKITDETGKVLTGER